MVLFFASPGIVSLTLDHDALANILGVSLSLSVALFGIAATVYFIGGRLVGNDLFSSFNDILFTKKETVHFYLLVGIIAYQFAAFFVYHCSPDAVSINVMLAAIFAVFICIIDVLYILIQGLTAYDHNEFCQKVVDKISIKRVLDYSDVKVTDAALPYKPYYVFGGVSYRIRNPYEAYNFIVEEALRSRVRQHFIIAIDAFVRNLAKSSGYVMGDLSNIKADSKVMLFFKAIKVSLGARFGVLLAKKKWKSFTRKDAIVAYNVSALRYFIRKAKGIIKLDDRTDANRKFIVSSLADYFIATSKKGDNDTLSSILLDAIFTINIMYDGHSYTSDSINIQLIDYARDVKNEELKMQLLDYMAFAEVATDCNKVPKRGLGFNQWLEKAMIDKATRDILAMKIDAYAMNPSNRTSAKEVFPHNVWNDLL